MLVITAILSTFACSAFAEESKIDVNIENIRIVESHIQFDRYQKAAGGINKWLHMRELIEMGFEVIVVTDATAGAITGFYDGYEAALVNYRMIASKIDNTENTVKAIRTAYKK